MQIHLNEGVKIMKQSKYALFTLVLALLAFTCVMALAATAQDITHPSTTETKGPPTHAVHQTHVQNAEVIHVSGHEIVVLLENGKLELLNLPKDFMFNVDGKHVTVHELRPGTKLSQEIHTVTTPEEVTTLRTVNGKVFHVSGPHVILAFPNGEHKQYTVPDGIVFNIDGQEKTVFDLRKGMEVSATVLRVAPQQVVTTHTVVTGEAPPRPEIAFEGPLLIEPPAAAPEVTAAAEQPAMRELPQTGSLVPLTGVLGFALLVLYASLRIVRKNMA
jgi:hypothetical protein